MFTLNQLLDAAQTRIQAALAFRKQGYLESAQTELQNLLQDLTVGFHEDKPDEPDPKKQDGDARTG